MNIFDKVRFCLMVRKALHMSDDKCCGSCQYHAKREHRDDLRYCSCPSMLAYDRNTADDCPCCAFVRNFSPVGLDDYIHRQIGRGLASDVLCRLLVGRAYLDSVD